MSEHMASAVTTQTRDAADALVRRLLEAMVGTRRVVEIGFGAGPAWAATWQRRFAFAIELGDALTLLEAQRSDIRRAHIELDDGTRLFFDAQSRGDLRQAALMCE